MSQLLRKSNEYGTISQPSEPHMMLSEPGRDLCLSWAVTIVANNSLHPARTRTHHLKTTLYDEAQLRQSVTNDG